MVDTTPAACPPWRSLGRRDVFRGCKARVERFQAPGKRVHERHMMAPGRDDHAEIHPDACSGPDPPRSVGPSRDVFWIVDRLVAALHGQSVLRGTELQALGGVAKTDPII